MKKTLQLFFFALILPGFLFAQERVVRGKVVTDAEDFPLPGVNIQVKGTTIGTFTGGDGTYEIRVPSNEAVLVFSMIGYLQQEVTVGARTQIDIKLAEDIQTLGEVVVVGYGQQERKTLTSSISSVSAKDVENIPITSPDQLMQGRAAGVTVGSQSGEPGGGMFVRVRGTTSINGSSDPLYVIDGVPLQANNLAGSTFGQPVNPLADINPADIASIEILKDASATAIYGARAANGVVLITTKRGSEGRATVTVNSFVGTSKAWRDPNSIRVDGPTFEMLQNEAARNNGRPEPYPNPSQAIDTNWFDYLFQEASSYNLDVSVSGGDERVKYFVSGNQNYQEGILKPANFERTTGRMNLEFLASDKLKVGINATYGVNTRNRALNGNAINGALSTAYFYPSNFPVYNADGSYYRPFWENPVAVAVETDYLMRTTRFIGSAFAEYEITNGLIFRSTWSMDNSFVEEDQYSNTRLATGEANNGSASSTITRDNNWINENVLTYQTRFGTDHDLNVLFGNTLQENRFNRTNASGTQFANDLFKNIASAAVKNSSSVGSSWGISSYFTRINYGFQGKYLLTLNMRADASSRFGADNRWGYFPSVAAAWRISDEAFMQDLSVISDMKFRVSYGVTGNQAGIGDFQSRGLWGGQRGGLNLGGQGQPGGPAAYVDDAGITANQLANPDLKWETTNQINLGLDLGLFDDKLNITFDVYNKQTKDLLLAVPVPRTTGYSSLVQNFGEIENKGFELGINGTIIQKSDFNWNASFNISQNKNLVKKIASPFTTFTRDYIRVEEGAPLYSFWVHVQNGVDPETGNIIWESGDDATFNPNVHRYLFGDANPRFVGGLTNTLNYKNFDMMVFFQFSEGNEVLNYGRFFFEHGGTRTTGYTTQQLDRWQQPGDITDVPRMTSANYAANLRPSRHVEDGSYLRLKNLMVGYAIPTDLTSRLGIGMSRARVYFQAQNLLTWTNYTGLDPEVSTSPGNLVAGVDIAVMPQPRTFTGGITLTF